jgi:hypothetical protein
LGLKQQGEGVSMRGASELRQLFSPCLDNFPSESGSLRVENMYCWDFFCNNRVGLLVQALFPFLPFSYPSLFDRWFAPVPCPVKLIHCACQVEMNKGKGNSNKGSGIMSPEREAIIGFV